MLTLRAAALVLIVALLAISSIPSLPATAASRSEIERDVDSALAKMWTDVPNARMLAQQATAILVFPNIVKAGFLFGAQYGDGALRQRGRTVGYYNTVSASYGLQAGVQSFGYVLFFMSPNAVSSLERSDGFELGLGPSIVILDAGKARAMTTTTMKDDIYAYIFDQRGLMAGAGLQGSKISRIDR